MQEQIQSKWAWLGIWLTCACVSIIIGVIRHIVCKGKCTRMEDADGGDVGCYCIKDEDTCEDEDTCIWDSDSEGGTLCYSILAIGGLVGLLTCIACCCCCWRWVGQSHACMTPPSRWVNWFNIGAGTKNKCTPDIVGAQAQQRMTKVLANGP